VEVEPVVEADSDDIVPVDRPDELEPPTDEPVPVPEPQAEEPEADHPQADQATKPASMEIVTSPIDLVMEDHDEDPPAQA